MAPKLRHDANEVAFDLVQRATGQKPKASGKNLEAQERGRAGGRKGGKARAKSLSRSKKRLIARKGAAARWKNPPRKPE